MLSPRQHDSRGILFNYVDCMQGFLYVQRSIRCQPPPASSFLPLSSRSISSTQQQVLLQQFYRCQQHALPSDPATKQRVGSIVHQSSRSPAGPHSTMASYGQRRVLQGNLGRQSYVLTLLHDVLKHGTRGERAIDWGGAGIRGGHGEGKGSHKGEDNGETHVGRAKFGFCCQR